jgi:hypothetical protein
MMFAVLVLIRTIFTAYSSNLVLAHDDAEHYHTNYKSRHHSHDHHHYGHISHGSVGSSRVRSRMLVKDIFNATVSTTTSGRCATHDPSPEIMAESSRIVQEWMANPNSRQTTTINVDTYFHIITSDMNLNTGENETVGIITDADVTNQLQVLNDSYRPYGFTFTLKGTTRNNNTEWYYFNSLEMKSALRVGDASTLNVYFTEAYGLAGYATFPSEYELFPEIDGVVVNSGTIPGGAFSPYDEGKTLVHEIGHWLGLFHTFQTDPNIPYFNALFFALLIGEDRLNCRYNTDEVRDTPKQSSPTRGCPTGRNSCRLYPGLDPIHNYMDYSDDSCYNEFTNGQMNRMKAMWNEYRVV